MTFNYLCLVPHEDRPAATYLAWDGRMGSAWQVKVLIPKSSLVALMVAWGFGTASPGR